MEAFEYNNASKNGTVKNNTRVWQIVYFILWITSVTYEAQWNSRGNIYCKYTNILGQPIKCQTPILAELVWKIFIWYWFPWVHDSWVNEARIHVEDSIFAWNRESFNHKNPPDNVI